MTDDHPTALISAIHHSGRQMVLAITGGGSSAIGELLRVPGGSSSLLEAVVPYSWSALIDWLGGQPDEACSARTARAMAMAAFQRARRLADASVPLEKLVGVGCTASLASDRPKRGEHRFHLGFQTLAETRSISLTLQKGLRTRAEEEALVCELLLHDIAAMCGVKEGLLFAIDLLAPHLAPNPERLPQVPEIRNQADVQAMATPEMMQLMSGELAGVRYERGRSFHLGPDETLVRDTTRRLLQQPAPGPPVIFPGAFRPRHEGHLRMAEVATRLLGRPVEFEISIENVDKPPLDYFDMRERLKQFSGDEAIWLTCAPTFVEKSGLFPGATFIVGADTILRIANPKYYRGEAALRDEAVGRIVERGCRFLVFGRLVDGAFETLDDLQLPPALAAICTPVPEREFRADISSTELRRQQEQQQQ